VQEAFEFVVVNVIFKLTEMNMDSSALKGWRWVEAKLIL